MRIAVATDFSDRSYEAFPVAASIAECFSAEVCVVHQAVLATFGFPAPGPVDVVYRAAEAKLAEIAKGEEALRKVGAKPLLLRGGNSRTFAEFLEENGVDLLVVASHGRTGAGRLLLGSFAEKALRFARCSTLVFRRENHETPAAGGFYPRRMLVPHDLSPYSLASVHAACEWARRFGAAVRLLNVVSFEAGATGFGPDLLGSWHAYEQRMEQAGREELEKIAREDLSSLSTEVVVREGHPVLEILEQAEEYAADLIAMGTHGRSGMEHFFLGSVTEKVVRKAHCPVLAIRSASGAGERTEARS